MIGLDLSRSVSPDDDYRSLIRCTRPDMDFGPPLASPSRERLMHLLVRSVPVVRLDRRIARKEHQPPTPRHEAINWAQRLKRVFGIEIDTCRRCGGTLAIIATIEQPEVIAKIFAHLERTAPLQPKQPEVPLGARAPPVQSTLL